MSVAAMLQAEVLNVFHMIGPLGLIGLAAFCVYQARSWKQRPAEASLLLFCGWIFPPLLWFAIFRNQSAIHEFTTILLAPIAVYALADCVVKLMDRLAATRGTVAPVGYRGLATFAPLLLLVPLARQIHGSVQIHRIPGRVLPVIEPSPWIMAPDDYVNFGLAIREKERADVGCADAGTLCRSSLLFLAPSRASTPTRNSPVYFPWSAASSARRQSTSPSLTRTAANSWQLSQHRPYQTNPTQHSSSGCPNDPHTRAPISTDG